MTLLTWPKSKYMSLNLILTFGRYSAWLLGEALYELDMRLSTGKEIAMLEGSFGITSVVTLASHIYAQ